MDHSVTKSIKARRDLAIETIQNMDADKMDAGAFCPYIFEAVVYYVRFKPMQVGYQDPSFRKSQAIAILESLSPYTFDKGGRFYFDGHDYFYDGQGGSNDPPPGQ